MRRWQLIVVVLMAAACSSKPAPAAAPTSAAPSVAVTTPAAPAPRPSVVTSPRPHASRLCRAADLQLRGGEPTDEATGQHTIPLVLTNTSPTACYVTDYPRILLFDARGHELPFDYRLGGDQMVTDAPAGRVDLGHGQQAFVTFNKYRCDGGDKGAAVRVQLRLSNLSAGLSMALPPYGYCGPGDPGTTVSVSPFEPTAEQTYAH